MIICTTSVWRILWYRLQVWTPFFFSLSLSSLRMTHAYSWLHQGSKTFQQSPALHYTVQECFTTSGWFLYKGLARMKSCKPLLGISKGLTKGMEGLLPCMRNGGQPSSSLSRDFEGMMFINRNKPKRKTNMPRVKGKNFQQNYCKAACRDLWLPFICEKGRMKNHKREMK